MHTTSIDCIADLLKASCLHHCNSSHADLKLFSSQICDTSWDDQHLVFGFCIFSDVKHLVGFVPRSRPASDRTGGN